MITNGEKLLVEFAKTGSDSAFRDLVNRHIGLVHATALRLVRGDTHTAQDVTQTVFVDLARMAGTLSGEVVLSGWLHRHTCWVAAKVMRGQRRRQIREQQALDMNSQEDHSAAILESLAPILDESIDHLGSQDRLAIVLRYFEQRDLRSVGCALGTNEDAAQKRVSRALEKLRVLLKKRGVTYPAAAIGAALGGGLFSGAPAGLAATVAGVALSGKATGSGSALFLLKLMTMTKIKAAIIGAVAVAAITIPATMQQHLQVAELRQQNQRLRQESNDVAQLKKQNQKLRQQLSKSSGQTLTSDQTTELLRLRNTVGLLRNQKMKDADDTVKLTEDRVRLEAVQKILSQMDIYRPDPYADPLCAQLVQQGFKVVPDLLTTATNLTLEMQTRVNAVEIFSRIVSKTNAPAGTDFQAAIPVLLKCMNDTEPALASLAALSFGDIGTPAKTVIPDLIEATKSPIQGVRAGAICSLGQFGPDADKALPALQEALNDNDSTVRITAARAIVKIRGY